jgi:hypothetical protein
MRDIKKSRIVSLFLIIVLLSLALPGSVNAQAGVGERFFPETGHTVSGVFLTFFESFDEPLLYFGYPITDELIDPIDGQRSQYFQRARFDLIENGNGESAIRLAPLGELLHDGQGLVIPTNQNVSACRRFDTGQEVCYGFLAFYDNHGGSMLFGDPISGLEQRDDRLVQYFERARFEWRPEQPAGSRVGLTDLGRIYFDKRIGNQAFLQAKQGSNILSAPIKLASYAFVTSPMAASGSQQKVFIIVQDQNFNPVPGASVQIAVHLPGELGAVYRSPDTTDGNGIASLVFQVDQYASQQIVEIEVTAEYNGLITKTSTWFRVWN